MARKFIFYTHAYARRVLERPDYYARVTLNNHIQNGNRDKVRPLVRDVAQWVYDQFARTDTRILAASPDGRVHSFRLRYPATWAARRRVMANRLLAEPNRRVVITAVLDNH